MGSSVDVVKLDMSLLGWERGRLTGLVERLHDHGKVVLVEGVESAAHERLAVETGMDLASGYRYAAVADRAAVRRVSERPERSVDALQSTTTRTRPRFWMRPCGSSISPRRCDGDA